MPWKETMMLEHQVRRVRKNGALRWCSTKWVVVAVSLSGKDVGLEDIESIFQMQTLWGS